MRGRGRLGRLRDVKGFPNHWTRMAVANREREAAMLARLVLRLLINACALAAAAHFVSGIGYEGYSSLLAMALIFGIVNTMIRPVVTVLSCPLLILTLGLFTFVINGAMLYLAGTIAAVLGLRF